MPDPVRHGDGRLGRDARAPARGERRRLHALGPDGAQVWLRALGTTRSAAALELWRPQLAGAVVVVGNAPTALFRLLEMIEQGRRPPRGRDRRAGRFHRRRRVEGRAGRASLGARAPHRPRPARRQRDRGRGGQRARPRRGVARDCARTALRRRRRPGRPRALTLKAQRIISAVPTSWPTRRPGTAAASPARIAAPHLRDAPIELAMTYPDHGRGDGPSRRLRGRDLRFYDDWAARLAGACSSAAATSPCCARATRFIYGSYIYLHERLARASHRGRARA